MVSIDGAMRYLVLGTKVLAINWIAAPFFVFSCGGLMHTGDKGVFIMYITFFLQYMVKIIVWFSVFERWEVVLDGFFYTFAVE